MISIRRLCDVKNINNIVRKVDKEIVWRIKRITTHKEPFIVFHPNYKGAWCNVTVEWEIEKLSHIFYSVLHYMTPSYVMFVLMRKICC